MSTYQVQRAVFRSGPCSRVIPISGVRPGSWSGNLKWDQHAPPQSAPAGLNLLTLSHEGEAGLSRGRQDQIPIPDFIQDQS